MAFEDSTFFIKKPPFAQIDSESFLYTKELLSGKIFLGEYEERRFVPSLLQYRDLVVIHPDEQELQYDLIKVKKKLMNNSGIKWVGITIPEELSLQSYCFWVKLSKVPFGCYWFQIKHVKLIDEELILVLKCIRKFKSVESSRSSSLKSKMRSESQDNSDGEPRKTLSYIENWDLDPKRCVTICSEALENILPYLTWKNFLTVARVLIALAIVLVMGMISVVGNLGEYLLRLIRELSHLVQTLTPIIIQAFDFFSKIVGGLYLLLYGIFTKTPRPPPQYYSNFYTLEHSNKNSPRAPIDWRKRNQLLRKELLLLELKTK